MRPPDAALPRSRRRVAFVADSDAWGGAEVYLTHLLRRAGANGWEATLVAAEPVAERFAALVPAERLDVVPLARHTASAPQVGAVLRRLAPDVVHVNLVDPGSNAAAVDAALSVAPGAVAATLHLGGDTGAGSVRERLRTLYARLGVLLTPAEDVAAQVRADLGVPRGGVHVVDNGVDVPPDPAGPAGREPVRIGAAGRLTEQKGFDVLLDAVRLLVQDGERFDVVVGGAGREEAALRAAAAGLPVELCGFVADGRAFLAGLDVFCLPSRREAMPLALLEAMAEGLPCVATDVGAVRVAVGDAALVVLPEDPAALAEALRRLVRSAPARAHLGARARERAVAALDADLMARRTYALLAPLTGAPGSATTAGPATATGPATAAGSVTSTG